MKRILLLFSLFAILFSRSESVFADYTAYEGYQLVLAQMEAEKYDLAKVNLVTILTTPNVPLNLGNGQKFYIKMSFEGEDIGKSNYWMYYINYKDKDLDDYYYGILIYVYGKPIVQITQVKPNKLDNVFIELTEEIDSPIFVKKLVETTAFVDNMQEIEVGDENRTNALLFTHLHPDNYSTSIPDKEADYWIATLVDKIEKTESNCLLLADENIINNTIECFEINNNEEGILENNVDISIYPNPVVENINIAVPEELKNNVSSIQLFDVNGSLLDNINTYNYNVSNLANGTYYICFTINNCKYYRAFIVAN